jgi:hypothetical protein
MSAMNPEDSLTYFRDRRFPSVESNVRVRYHYLRIQFPVKIINGFRQAYQLFSRTVVCVIRSAFMAIVNINDSG